MKNTFISVALMLGIICVTQIWAQEDPASESTSITTLEQRDATGNGNDDVESVEAAESENSGFSIDIELGDDETDNESLKKLARVIKEVAGEEVANEVIIELDGLSPEEKAELKQAFKDGFPTDQIPGWVGAVAILAILMIFGAPVWILLVVFIFGARKRKQKMQLIQMYLDADRDVPQQVLATFGQSSSSFRSGIMLSAVGLGILAAFSAAGNEPVGALGLIPLFIGMAKLLYWFIEERKFESK